MASYKPTEDICFHAKLSRSLTLNKKRTTLSSFTSICIVNTDRPLEQGEIVDIIVENDGNLNVLFLNETNSDVLDEIAFESYGVLQVLQISFEGKRINVQELVYKRIKHDIDIQNAKQIRVKFEVKTEKISITLSKVWRQDKTNTKVNTEPLRLVPLGDEQMNTSMDGMSASRKQLVRTAFFHREVSAGDHVKMTIKKLNSDYGHCTIKIAPKSIIESIMNGPQKQITQNVCKELERRSILIKKIPMERDTLGMSFVVDFPRNGWPVFFINETSISFEDGDERNRFDDSKKDEKKKEIGMGTLRTSVSKLEKENEELKKKMESLSKTVANDDTSQVTMTKIEYKSKGSIQLLDKWITPNYNSLCRGLNLDGLLPRLLQDHLLTDNQYDEINSKGPYNEKVEQVLGFLKRQPETKRDKLVNALEKSSSNDHVVVYFQDLKL